MIIFWDITHACNFRCKHCYNHSLYFSTDALRRVSLAEQEVFAIAENIIRSRAQRVHFLGGEPLLYKPLLKLVRYLSNEGVVVSVNTNGSLLTPEYSKQLIGAGIGGITVSLDGATPESNDLVRGMGAFWQAISGIEAFIAARNSLSAAVPIAIGFTLTRPGIETIDGLVPLAISLGVDQLNVQYLSDFGGAGQAEVKRLIGYTTDEAMHALESLVDQARNLGVLDKLILDTRPLFSYYIKLKYGVIITNDLQAPPVCEGGVSQINIRADGTVHPCSPADDLWGGSAISRGAFTKQDLRLTEKQIYEIQSSEYFTSFRAFVEQREQSQSRPSTCKGCPYKDNCIPCPLDIKPGEEVEECRWVKEQLFIIESKILKKKFTFNKHILLSNDQVVDTRSHAEYSVNETGSELLVLLERGLRLRDIVNIVHEKYAIPFSQAKHDVLDFASGLVASGLGSFN